MEKPKFIQLHTLTSYPATLLNRDDAGFAKRMPFGGTNRTRISSQCLKYHWRNYDGDKSLYSIDVPHSLRSRETFVRKVARPLIHDGLPEKAVLGATYHVKEILLSGKGSTKAALKKIVSDDEKNKPWKEIETNQITVLGEPEVNYLKQLIRQTLEDNKERLGDFFEGKEGDPDSLYEVLNDISSKDLTKNLKGMRMAAGLDAAMFGRMVTSDILSRGDAAVHVAHALTTHAEESESDYFSAVDELRRDEPEESGELGAGHINSTELTSGLYYSYIVIDVPLLVSNIEGVPRKEWEAADLELTKEVIKRMVHLIATVSPGAKLGSTAPYAYADLLLVEVGNTQPRTLANAFRNAVGSGGKGVLANSYSALAKYLHNQDQMYGNPNKRKLGAIEMDDELLANFGVEQTDSMPDIAEWAANRIGG